MNINNIDLNIDNYNVNDLYNLFNIDINTPLTKEILFQCKKKVLKTHPDKSGLNSDIFIFFTSAYKRLYALFDFANNSTKTPENVAYSSYNINNKEIIDDETVDVLNKFLKQNDYSKNTKKFNKWFNSEFEKYQINNPLEEGHGNWLQSNDDIYEQDSNVTKSNMNSAFEKHKTRLQGIVKYEGVQDMQSNFNGSMLNGDVSNSTNNYTDLKQAHIETIIPITQTDINNIQTYRNVSEYKNKRDSMDTTPMSNSEANKFFIEQNKKTDEQSIHTAFKLAREVEHNTKNLQLFKKNMLRLT